MFADHWIRKYRADVERAFDDAVDFGDKDEAEFMYQQVYELREYMNRVHAGKVWRTEVKEGGT